MTTMQFPILSALILLPLLGVGLIILLTWRAEASVAGVGAKCISLIFSGLNLLLSLYLIANFDAQNAELQFTETISWMSSYNISYLVGIDGLSAYFILLTALLIPICIITSWNSITYHVKEYMILFLLLETLVIGVFAAQDLILFYLFFEAVLIPMFLIIGIWGGENRVYAAYKFFLYTLLGSILMLIAVLYIYLTTETTDMRELVTILPQYTVEVQKWLWLAFFISFAVKVPMWPVHTWLPDAHVQAPTAGSVILAGVLLKMGGYGFLRFSIPMLPMASYYFANFIFILSIIGVIYTSLVALVQEDMKKLVAYSSIAHMAYVTAGIFTFSQEGLTGAIFQMISHGLVASALFLCVGVLYDRMHTKEIKFYSGLAARMPSFALVTLVMVFASIGLPSTSGFVGEFLVLVASFRMNYLYGLLIATGLVLGAAYMLWLTARVFFGKINNNVKDITDISLREKIIFIPLLLLVIFLGIYPNVITRGLHKSVEKAIEPFMLSVQPDMPEPLLYIIEGTNNIK